MLQQAAEEKQNGRGNGAIDGGRGTSHLSVGQQHGYGRKRHGARRQTEPTPDYKEQHGQDRDVATGDRDDVIRPRRL